MIEVRLLFLFFAGAFAACKPPKPCPHVTPMKNFNLTLNDGVWYVVEKYPVAANLEERCITQYFEDLQDGSVRLETWLVGVKSGKRRIDDGLAKFVEGESIFTEFYSGVEYEEQWILGSDYETFSVHFACGELSPHKVDNVWILAKTKQPDDAAIVKAHQVLIDNGLDVDLLEAEEWQSCPQELAKK